MNCKEIFYFSFGFSLSLLFVLAPLIAYKKSWNVFQHKLLSLRVKSFLKSLATYDETLSSSLFSEVKVLCLVLTHPRNHKTKAIHVKETWGRKCSKLLFVSSQPDDQLDIVIFPINESREVLWNKTRAGFKYAYEHYIDDFDWFLKADDDSYIIMENLRLMLSQYNSSDSLLLGNRYAGNDEGYMAGGSYILSKKALRKFVENLMPNETICNPGSGSEDKEMERCLAHEAILVDCRDEFKQKRFFPNRDGILRYVEGNFDPEDFFTQFQYYDAAQASLNCCSANPIGFHYIKPPSMYSLECYIYNVHPFGLELDVDILPRKLTLDEIISASDVKSNAKFYREHRHHHIL